MRSGETPHLVEISLQTSTGGSAAVSKTPTHPESTSGIPSSHSADHGRPFKDIFASYDYDFYKIDRHLFSPAVVTLVNLDTGNSFRFGHLEPDVLNQSFGCAGQQLDN